jgi:hypothetical protein
MALLRNVPRFGGFPGLRCHRCAACEEAVTLEEEEWPRAAKTNPRPVCRARLGSHSGDRGPEAKRGAGGRTPRDGAP